MRDTLTDANKNTPKKYFLGRKTHDLSVSFFGLAITV